MPLGSILYITHPFVKKPTTLKTLREKVSDNNRTVFF